MSEREKIIETRTLSFEAYKMADELGKQDAEIRVLRMTVFNLRKQLEESYERNRTIMAKLFQFEQMLPAPEPVEAIAILPVDLNNVELPYVEDLQFFKQKICEAFAVLPIEPLSD